jgi:hypothetical protein
MRDNSKTGNPSRRRLLKLLAGSGMAAGGAALLPQRWTRPMVEAVMLPAHAALSQLVFYGTGLPALVSQNGPDDDGTQVAGLPGRLAEAVIPSARAQRVQPTSTVCAMLSGDILDVTLQRSQNNARRRGPLNIDGTPGVLSVTDVSPNCEGREIPIFDLDAYVSNYNPATGFYLNITVEAHTAFAVFVPLADGCLGFATLDGACGGD